jgi:hypothetical protein
MYRDNSALQRTRSYWPKRYRMGGRVYIPNPDAAVQRMLEAHGCVFAKAGNQLLVNRDNYVLVELPRGWEFVRVLSNKALLMFPDGVIAHIEEGNDAPCPFITISQNCPAPRKRAH